MNRSRTVTTTVSDGGWWRVLRGAVLAVAATASVVYYWHETLGAFLQHVEILFTAIAVCALVVLVGPAFARWRGARTAGLGGLADAAALARQGPVAHRRVRVALYTVLLAIAGQATVQAWHTERLERARAQHAHASDLAGAQRMLSQRIARLASAILAAQSDRGVQQELRSALARVERDGAQLNALVADGEGVARSEALDGAMVAMAINRTRLVEVGRAMLDHMRSGNPNNLPAFVAAVHERADPALRSAQALVDALHAGARERYLAASGEAKLWAVLTLVLIAALALLVAEPAVWSIRQQSIALEAQTVAMKRLALVAERTTNAVMITDARQRIVWTNQAFTQITGFSREDAVGHPSMRLLAGHVEGRAAGDSLPEALVGGEGARLQVLNRTKEGRELWLDLDVQPLLDDAGDVTGYVNVASDITARRVAQAELRVAAIAFDALEAIVVTDANQVILKVNRAFTRITGYTAEEATGQVTGRLLRSGRHDDEFYAAMWEQLLRARHWHGEIWNRRKNGEVYPQWLSITAVTDDDGSVMNYVAVFTDISQRKKAEEIIHSLAYYDPLTELPNRRLLRDRLREVASRSEIGGQHAAVLFIDLDRFKELNDTKGHDVGDLLLTEVAKRLTAAVRSTDTVARLGGDEFVVVVADLSTDAAQAASQSEKVADAILSTLRGPFELQGHDYRTTPSIGIHLFRGNDQGVDELLKRADVAMYEAKRSGRNTARFFDPETHAALERRIALEADLRGALGAGQFHLEYQVQVDAQGDVVGAEALLRWAHPERGPVPPNEFIPVAEETDLIIEIGDWVLREAGAQLKAWAVDPVKRRIQLAVNVSARQFRRPDFVESVSAIVADRPSIARNLKLELTESLVLLNLQDTIGKMQALKQLGIGLALDDFGTGYSSLAYLTRLPLDQLKIDQSFVRSMMAKRSDAVVVQTIVGMARSLDLEVIAEGVETREQMAMLDRHGCRRYQGYLFSRPLRIDAFEALLARMRVRDDDAAPSAGLAIG